MHHFRYIINHMVNNHSSPLDFTFAALADPTRRAIIDQLAQGVSTPSELAQPLTISKPALSKHLRVLERAGLLQRDIKGREHKLKLIAQPMQDAQLWIERYREFWDNQLEALQAYFEQSLPELKNNQELEQKPEPESDE